MKKYIFLLFAVLFLQNSKSFSASLNSFAVQSSYLSSGNVIINANPTTIQVDFSIIRSLVGAGYENVNWTVTLVLRDINTDDYTLVTNPISITNADFVGNFCSKTITATLPANKYTTLTGSGVPYNSRLSLRYSAYDFTNNVTLQPIQSSTYYNVLNQYFGTNPYPLFNYGQVNTLYDGIGVPIPAAQYYYNFPNTSGIGSLRWDNGVPSPGSVNYSGGTIINFSNTIPMLTPGQSIFSPNGLYRLTLQTDGNLVLYQENLPGETGLWSTRTNGQTAGSVFFQTDGHLVVYSGPTSFPEFPSSIRRTRRAICT